MSNNIIAVVGIWSNATKQEAAIERGRPRTKVMRAVRVGPASSVNVTVGMFESGPGAWGPIPAIKTTTKRLPIVVICEESTAPSDSSIIL